MALRQVKTKLLGRGARLADAIERRRAPRPDPALEALGRLATQLDGQYGKLIELEQRVADTQALVARAYEAAGRWPAQLAQVRADADFALAWEEDEPLVSVRIATYNNAALLCERTLASVRRQSYARWECIVVGDAVTDDTAERVEALGDDRIRFVNLPYRGPYPADPTRRWLVAGTTPMNRGSQEAGGRWLAPLDHDDEWDPDHIERLLEHARRTRAELVYGKLRTRDAVTGSPLPEVVGAWPPTFGEFGFQGALYHAALRCFEVDPNARFAGEPGDWNLARRLWDAGVRFAFLDRVVTTYYRNPVAAAAAAPSEPEPR